MKWDWDGFAGSEYVIKLAKRDLCHLDETVKLTRGRTAAVQAGGNVGIYPKRLAQRFGVTYTFEPAADLWPLLLRNAPEHNIVKIQAALGYERGLVTVSRERRDGKPNAHEGIGYTVPGGIVPTLRIDDLGLPACDLIYLDIEGAELPAMRGAVETLARCRPVVGLEVNKNLGFVGLKEKDVHRFMSEHGYRHHKTMGSDQVFIPKEWSES